MKPQFTFACPTVETTQALAAAIGQVVKGGDVFAFHSDIGGGKTAFVKGLARGMGVTDVVQSPTFTLSQIHKAERGLELHHYDFYRLTDAGIMRAELAESLAQPNAVVAIEWGDIVHDVLPPGVVKIDIHVQNDDSRSVAITCAPRHQHILQALQNYQQNRTIT